MVDQQKVTAGLTPTAIQGCRWRIFDAKDQVLGRLASRIAVVLQGKDKPTYSPNKEEGDICIVVNARHVALTGNKLNDKVYTWHTGFVGGLKQRNVKDQMKWESTEVLRTAVHRMLPKNKLQDDRMRKLRLFPDETHNLEGFPMEEYVMPPRNVREMRPRQKRALKKNEIAAKLAAEKKAASAGAQA